MQCSANPAGCYAGTISHARLISEVHDYLYVRRSDRIRRSSSRRLKYRSERSLSSVRSGSVLEDCADGTENMNREKDSITPIKDMDYLTSAVAILRDSNVEQMVEEALQKSAKVLSGSNTTVCIIVADPQSTFVRDYMNGVSGSTVRAGRIWLEIYPNGDWRDWIPYTLAHEYHHSVWMDRQGRQSKLSDMV